MQLLRTISPMAISKTLPHDLLHLQVMAVAAAANAIVITDADGVEVMKMFNKINAQFSGTVDKILVQGGDGTIVQKGQPLFKITPDEKFIEVDLKAVEKEKRERTAGYLKAVLHNAL